MISHKLGSTPSCHKLPRPPSALLRPSKLTAMGRKLHLAVDKVVARQEGGQEEEFRPEDLNIMLAFQVNCPGCFMHAIPFLNSLHERYSKQGVQVFALSTAFEEFGLNTVWATTALVQKDQIFGATRNALGKDKYGRDINFRVATDKGLPQSASNASPLGGETFRRNNFMGTPTYVVFDRDLNIKLQWFGHQDAREVEAALDKIVKA